METRWLSKGCKSFSVLVILLILCKAVVSSVTLKTDSSSPHYGTKSSPVKYNLVTIDKLSNNARLTTSGISAGAVMAVQLHFAYSSMIKGSGIVAGVPYYCAQDDVEIALSACMRFPELISILELEAIIRNTANFDFIDDPSLFLKDARVLVFSGTSDSVVAKGSVVKVAEQFQHYNENSENNIVQVYDVPAAHAWVTDLYGNQCTYLGSPYINNCGVDMPGRILQHVLSSSNNGRQLKTRVRMNPNNLFQFEQKPYVPFTFFTMYELGILDYGFIYIPTACQKSGNDSSCDVHIALHGCEMSAETIADTFAKESGLNEWAEANNVIVIYPQSRKNELNPKGCWDWWGYTGMQYASNIGYQMKFIKNVMSAVTGK